MFFLPQRYLNQNSIQNGPCRARRGAHMLACGTGGHCLSFLHSLPCVRDFDGFSLALSMPLCLLCPRASVRLTWPPCACSWWWWGRCCQETLSFYFVSVTEGTLCQSLWCSNSLACSQGPLQPHGTCEREILELLQAQCTLESLENKFSLPLCLHICVTFFSAESSACLNKSWAVIDTLFFVKTSSVGIRIY